MAADQNHIPSPVRENLGALDEEEADLAVWLAENGQAHLFEKWEPPGCNDHLKRGMITKLLKMSKTMPGGIADYLQRARSLLSQAGSNAFEGWVPEVPHGVNIEPFAEETKRLEKIGISQIGKCGFVLVAGGLGERLGYSGIKVELPVETVTRTCYLDLYCQQILAMQERYAAPGFRLPLAIMVSDDTHDKTIDLLQRNNYFGMDPHQITLLKQGVVPALMSNDARIALKSTYDVEAKPHGHGDVHLLMHSSGTASSWLENGIRYIIFFQDTNGLAFFTLPAMLGVSEEHGMEVNSLTIPRRAKQAIGALASLAHRESNAHMTVNVEYNQLDPLLRSTISPEGDSNDPATGYSPFPGNINQLVFLLQPYVRVLDRTDGRMPEFVNPKYADASRTAFKKPTRLECMMQDYPKLLDKTARVGFSMAPAWLCFSPCKNNSAEAAKAVETGTPAASPATAESDQYAVFVKLLQLVGVQVDLGDEEVIDGVSVRLSPRIVLHPSCAIFPHEVASRFPSPRDVRISARSTLVMFGHVVCEKLRLDGSLAVYALQGAQVTLRLREEDGKGEAKVENAGHRLERFEGQERENLEEVDKIRGYILRVDDMATVQRSESCVLESL